MKKELTDEQKALLLPNETEQKFGHRVESLSFGSTRFVIHKCDVCGLPKESLYKDLVKGIGWSHVQCRIVKIKQTNIQKHGVENSFQSSETKAKIKQTNLRKYGVEYPQQSSEIRQKSKQSNLQRYGVENVSQSLEIQIRKKRTNIQKHGVENSFQIPDVQKKNKQDNIEKYGTEYPFQSSEVQDKIKHINLCKYGVLYAILLPQFRQKACQSILERYGVEHPFQSCVIREKGKQAMVERYGVVYPSQLPENRNKLKNWCIENPDKIFVSKAESSILEWVQQYYPNAKKYKDGTYEIDVFIPNVNVGIEHDGLFWHREDRVGQSYHINKTKYFRKKDIRILHIFEHEWKNRQEQVKSFLLSAIGKNEYKIGARKCALLWSSLSEDIKQVHSFLETYHIQGQPNNTKHVIKVLCNNELLAVATFGKHHRNNKDWVLTRFCTKTNYTIQGVLSRVSKLASQQLKEDVLSWADYRLSQGNGYEKAGWVFEELLPPDYFYHKGIKVFSKQSRQKKTVNTPEGMTERQHAEADGLARVYDCGKIRYRYRYKVIGGSNGTT